MSSSLSQQEQKNDSQEEAEREQALQELFGTRIVTGPLQLKRPLQRHQMDDGLTDAQRAAEQAKERRLAEQAAKDKSYREKIQAFNEKLAKMPDHNEMPRISG